MAKKIVLTGGGSAGHVTPNLALIPGLKAHDIEVSYIGTHDGIERSLVHDIPYYPIHAGKLRRYASAKNISDAFRILEGFSDAKKILKEIKPDLVFAKGGFVSVPVVHAASRLRIPVILHESDYTPGLANRICIKKAQIICLSFDNAQMHDGKSVLTGSPVRADLLTGNKAEGLKKLGFTDKLPLLLIMGGSLGALAVNEAVDAAIDTLTQKYQIVHLRGKGKLNEQLNGKKNYRQFEYIDSGINDIFAAADLALSRSGANAVFEFLALKLPALLVPLPLSASRGDQILNANYFAEKGYAHILPQEELNAETLISALDDLCASRAQIIQAMNQSKEANGVQNVLNVLLESLSAS